MSKKPHLRESSFNLELITSGTSSLKKLLLPKIIAAGKRARVVKASNNRPALRGVRFDDYNLDNDADYSPWLAYSQSKTANLLFACSSAEKLKDRNILSFAISSNKIVNKVLEIF